MIHVVRSEWIKFRSVRSNVVLVLAAGALVVLIAVLAANEAKDDAIRPAGATCFQDPSETGGSAPQQVPCSDLPGVPQPETNLGDITVGVPFALFLFGALGVQIIGQEHRFNTIRPTFTAVPQRWRVLVAKLLVVGAATAVVALVMVAVCAAIGSAMLDDFAIDDLDQRVVWGTVLFSVGWTGLGMGVGAILRQPIAGMLVLLLEAFVVENVLQAVVKGSRPWLPFLNGIQMTLRDTNGEDLRSVTAGGVYFFVVAALVWGIGAALVIRRDA